MNAKTHNTHWALTYTYTHNTIQYNTIQYNTTLLPSDECTRNVTWYQAHSYTHSHQSPKNYKTKQTITVQTLKECKESF